MINIGGALGPHRRGQPNQRSFRIQGPVFDFSRIRSKKGTKSQYSFRRFFQLAIFEEPKIEKRKLVKNTKSCPGTPRQLDSKHKWIRCPEHANISPLTGRRSERRPVLEVQMFNNFCKSQNDLDTIVDDGLCTGMENLGSAPRNPGNDDIEIEFNSSQTMPIPLVHPVTCLVPYVDHDTREQTAYEAEDISRSGGFLRPRDANNWRCRSAKEIRWSKKSSTPHFFIAVVGMQNTGTTDLIHELVSRGISGSKTVSKSGKSTTLILDDQSYKLTFVEINADQIHDTFLDEYDAYFTVYSVAQRAAFRCAVSVLKSLKKLYKKFHKPTVLLSHEVEAGHHVAISADEGATTADLYECNFLHVSASQYPSLHNLLVETVREIEKSGLSSRHTESHSSKSNGKND